MAETIRTDKAHVITKEGQETKINAYNVLGKLGAIGRAQLIRCQVEGGPVLLMKRFNKQNVAKYVFERKPEDDNELELAAKLHHKNIIRTIEIIDDPQWSNVFMVMEYCSGGETMSIQKANKFSNQNLKNGKPSDEVLKNWIRGAVEGLKYMHDKHIVHRDIKPANILIGADDEVKIADFGISEEVDVDEEGIALIETSKNGGIVGTPPFLPLEAYEKAKMDGFKADIWSLGITMYVYINGKLPIHEVDQTKFVQKLRNLNNFNASGIFSSMRRRDTPKTIFLQSMLNTRNPSARPSTAALLKMEYLSE